LPRSSYRACTCMRNLLVDGRQRRPIGFEAAVSGRWQLVQPAAVWGDGRERGCTCPAGGGREQEEGPGTLRQGVSWLRGQNATRFGRATSSTYDSPCCATHFRSLLYAAPPPALLEREPEHGRGAPCRISTSIDQGPTPLDNRGRDGASSLLLSIFSSRRACAFRRGRARGYGWR
jgi:hypothetical protein